MSMRRGREGRGLEDLGEGSRNGDLLAIVITRCTEAKEAYLGLI